ncbi:MAG: hypothetical protein LJE87_04545 [Deltaproteobacteria bacterium]|nr:hypothetical protein [Deltaproteobacteria bacterium]
MRRLLTKARVGCVFVVLITLLLCSMVFAEEKPSVAIEQKDNLQRTGKEEIEEKRSAETELEEQEQQPVEIKQTEGEDEETEGTPILSRWPVEKITLGGFIDLDFDYYDHSDVADKNSDSTSDLGLGSVDLELRVFFNEWVKAKVVLAADDVGKEDGDDNIKLDEAIMTLECPWEPLYFVGGKTVLPFGVFEDRLIVGTILEDLYEVDTVGATLGFAPDFYGLDISFTVYEGQEIIENLEDFGVHEFTSDRQEEDDVSSFIANATLEPVEDMLSVSVYYDSEPGDGRRNQTIGGAFTLDVWKFSLDAEYITALEREKGDNGEENKDSAWVVGLAFQPLESVPLALVTRYEDFDDDQSGNQDEVLDHRYVAGFSYKFLKWATFFFEYDYLKYEKESGSDAADHVNELHFRIGLAF